MSKAKSTYSKAPTISNTPDLPSIDWTSLGAEAPKLLPSTPNELEKADAVMITYAEAEWAAQQQVFCQSGTAMPYSDRSTSYWEGWHEFKKDLTPQKDWTYWFYYRLVEIAGKKVYLIKSNTHLDSPGKYELERMTQLIIDYINPEIILSTGTAGGAIVDDHIGTVNITNAGAMYSKEVSPDKWPVYSNDWLADMSVANQEAFTKLLFPVPTTTSDLEGLVTAFNKANGTTFTLDKLNPGDVDYGSDTLKVADFTPKKTPLCTSDSFVIATNSGNYENYVCMEMDDAVIGEICNDNNTAFGFVRNISDPVQMENLLFKDQKNWGGSLYTAYGFYTSYNSALVSWALLYAKFKS